MSSPQQGSSISTSIMMHVPQEPGIRQKQPGQLVNRRKSHLILPPTPVFPTPAQGPPPRRLSDLPLRPLINLPDV
eukprot:3632879-Rhodomonas_salina.3